jgi:hypothetical protein
MNKSFDHLVADYLEVMVAGLRAGTVSARELTIQPALPKEPESARVVLTRISQTRQSVFVPVATRLLGGG